MTRDIEVHNSSDAEEEDNVRTHHLLLDVEDMRVVDHDGVEDMHLEENRLDGGVVVDSRGIVLDTMDAVGRVSADRMGFRHRQEVYRERPMPYP